MGGMGLIFTPVLVRHLLGPLGLSGRLGLSLALLGLIATPNSLFERYNASPVAQPSPPPHPTHPLMHAIHDITVVVKKLLKIQQC